MLGPYMGVGWSAGNYWLVCPLATLKLGEALCEALHIITAEEQCMSAKEGAFAVFAGQVRPGGKVNGDGADIVVSALGPSTKDRQGDGHKLGSRASGMIEIIKKAYLFVVRFLQQTCWVGD